MERTGNQYSRAWGVGIVLIAGLFLCGCATSADLRPVVEEHVPQLIKRMVADGTFNSMPGTLQIHPELLDGWIVESFTVEPHPPFSEARRRYPDDMRLLI